MNRLMAAKYPIVEQIPQILERSTIFNGKIHYVMERSTIFNGKIHEMHFKVVLPIGSGEVISKSARIWQKIRVLF